MSELSPKARGILARTSSKYDPSEADRDRLRKALHARIGLGVAAGVATGLAAPLAGKAGALPGTASPTATAAGGGAAGVAAKAGVASVVVKALAMVILVGSAAATVALTGGTATVVSATSSEAASTPSNTPPPLAPAVAVAAPDPSAGSAAPHEAPQRTMHPTDSSPSGPSVAARPLRPPPSSWSSGTAADPDPINAEVSLLRDAQAALRRHDDARALEVLDAHARRFPAGLLAEERAAVRIFALCELGRVDEGTREKASFLQAYPVSPQVARVRKACSDASAP